MLIKRRQSPVFLQDHGGVSEKFWGDRSRTLKKCKEPHFNKVKKINVVLQKKENLTVLFGKLECDGNNFSYFSDLSVKFVY